MLTFNLINAQAVITNHQAYCDVGNIIAVAQAEQAKFLLFNLPGIVIAVAAGKRAFIVKISDAVLHMPGFIRHLTAQAGVCCIKLNQYTVIHRHHRF